MSGLEILGLIGAIILGVIFPRAVACCLGSILLGGGWWWWLFWPLAVVGFVIDCVIAPDFT